MLVQPPGVAAMEVSVEACLAEFHGIVESGSVDFVVVAVAAVAAVVAGN